MEYAKPWLPIDAQIDRLTSRGVEIGDHEEAAHLLRTVGYYRLKGYLYPFRESERFVCDHGDTCVRVLSGYRTGTTLEDAARLIDFDRQLRILVLDAVERIEIGLRTQLGHTIGKLGPFAHEVLSNFLPTFATAAGIGSQHAQWLARAKERQQRSDEAFVAHFRDKYDGRMPIWALTEVLELGQVSRLYRNLRNDLATEIALAFNVPTKRLMASWIAAVNYVRNVAAHHARLFNRKLVVAPKRPRAGEVPLLEHLIRADAPKDFGVYNILAVNAYLLTSIHPGSDWNVRTAELLQSFPVMPHLDIGSMGAVSGWLDEDLWSGPGPYINGHREVLTNRDVVSGRKRPETGSVA